MKITISFLWFALAAVLVFQNAGWAFIWFMVWLAADGITFTFRKLRD